MHARSEPLTKIPVCFVPCALLLVIHLSCTACGGSRPRYLPGGAQESFRLTYSSVATHVFRASSTALERSPFFPPYVSRALSLSLFSSSSGITAVILPISITYDFMRCTLGVSSKQSASCLRWQPFSFLSSFLFHLAYPHYILCAYQHINILVYVFMCLRYDRAYR